MYMCTVIETRQNKTTMPKDNPCFSQEKRRAASGGTRTRDILCTRQGALPTEPLRQLSWAGRILNVLQGQRRLFPDKQGNSFQYMYMYMSHCLIPVELAHLHVQELQVILALK